MTRFSRNISEGSTLVCREYAPLDLEQFVAGGTDNIPCEVNSHSQGKPCANPDKAQSPSDQRKAIIEKNSIQSGCCTSTKRTTSDSYGRKTVDTNFDFTEMRRHSEADFEESTEDSSTRAHVRERARIGATTDDPGIVTSGWTRCQLHQTRSDRILYWLTRRTSVHQVDTRSQWGTKIDPRL